MDPEDIRRLAEYHTVEFALKQAQQYTYMRAAVSDVEAGLLRPSSERHAVILDAPRRTGKSVALRQLTARLRSQDPSRVAYCDLTDKRLPGLQELVEALVPRDTDPARPMMLLLDEVHYAGTEWPRDLKFAVDNLPVRIAVADSAAALVHSSIRDELHGRVTHVQMYPLSFAEWRDLRDHNGIAVPNTAHEGAMLGEGREYLGLGGFPDYVDRRAELPSVHADLRERVIGKAVHDDVGPLLGLRDVDSLERLFVSRLAASGGQLNRRDDARRAGTSEPTVRHWLQALLDTGLLWTLGPRTRSPGKYARAQPKLYAVDPSLVAACSLPVFGPAGGDDAVAARQIETAVAQALRLFSVRSRAQLSFHREKRGREVDFVVDLPDGRVHAVEVTLRDARGKVETLAHRAAELGACWTGVIAHGHRAETVTTDHGEVHLLPMHEALLRLSAPTEAWPW